MPNRNPSTPRTIYTRKKKNTPSTVKKNLTYKERQRERERERIMFR